ncbi:MAG: NAD(P)-dependent oxidoreductase [Lentimicrobiaceae bacterium]|nr:NAD(P)-dependent oxidoreductase [Lentimicrobiaceae bacterium]
MTFNDKIIQEDMELLAEQFNWSALQNTSILITGATGLIGKQLVFLLQYLNENKNANIKIYALVRSEQKAKTVFGNADITFVVNDVRQPLVLTDEIDYMIHGASITQSRAFVEHPVETMDTAYFGTRNMLEFARQKQVKSVVYLSSMEVFGVTAPQLLEVTENDYGYIDILNPRSSYSESKRLCECLCACYAAEFGVPVKIARLAQTFGTGIDYDDPRITAQLARCVIELKDIVLHTAGKTLRPSLYTRDAILGILTILFAGNNGEAYTIANKKTSISIREIAELVASQIAENKINIKYDITNLKENGFNQDLHLILNTDKLEALGWKAEVGLEEAYRRMIESMKCRKKE